MILFYLFLLNFHSRSTVGWYFHLKVQSSFLHFSFFVTFFFSFFFYPYHIFSIAMGKMDDRMSIGKYLISILLHGNLL